MEQEEGQCLIVVLQSTCKLFVLSQGSRWQRDCHSKCYGDVRPAMSPLVGTDHPSSCLGL